MSTDNHELREVVRQKYGAAARMGAFIRAKKPERSAP